MKIKCTSTAILNHGRYKKKKSLLLIVNLYTANRLKTVWTIKPKKLNLGFGKNIYKQANTLCHHMTIIISINRHIT